MRRLEDLIHVFCLFLPFCVDAYSTNQDKGVANVRLSGNSSLSVHCVVGHLLCVLRLVFGGRGDDGLLVI